MKERSPEFWKEKAELEGDSPIGAGSLRALDASTEETRALIRSELAEEIAAWLEAESMCKGVPSMQPLVPHGTHWAHNGLAADLPTLADQVRKRWGRK